MLSREQIEAVLLLSISKVVVPSQFCCALPIRSMGQQSMSSRALIIMHYRGDEVMPFADSEELAKNSGNSESALIYRLADTEPFDALLRAC